ncbi:MAG: type I-C CRISPR-associated endonuclease Cas1 [Verrucomicrobiae bacterium]|nr:type I-C CRISPR-associated endonuclease Cas1 [Verrucomicrobiae bacterium]
MKHLLNTLYVTSQNTYLARDGETVVVRQEKETKLQVPIHTLSSIICFGQVSCSPPLLGLCGARNVSVAFLTEQGKFLARIHGPVSGNVLLRKEQYRRADSEEKSAEIARSIVAAKIANSRTTLLRAAREHDDSAASAALSTASSNLSKNMQMLASTISLDSIRGIEGDAARQYFGVFEHLIIAQKESFFFLERTRRPPMDPMNALLSFLYTLLVHDVASALEGIGLDPAVGFLHRDRPGRPSLALDLMEEFRPMLADRVALTLVNRLQIQGKQFVTTETGAVLMDDIARKEVLMAWQKKKQEEIMHPFIAEKIAIGLIPHVQALLLARFLRGDLDGYPPFRWK